jgi:predicted esterase
VIERHLRVQRSARYYVLGSLGPDTRELWIACHGYGQLASGFAKPFERIASDTRAIIVPEALSRFYRVETGERHGPDTPVGASWMTREDREQEIADNIAYLDALASSVQAEIARPGARLTAFGFSQGVATVCRWVALGTVHVSRMILWGGNLAQDLQLGPAMFRGASVTLVAGRSDTVVPPEVTERAFAGLREHGIDADIVRHEGGHLLKRDVLEELASVSRADRDP